MDPATVSCPGCGLDLPRGKGVYEGSFHASPECWSVFCEVLAAEYQDAPLFGRVHQTTVDTYAVQHAGGRHPDKSVSVHLVGLHLALVRRVPPPEIHPYLRALTQAVPEWPHFEPPDVLGAPGRITVLDVALAGSSADHAAIVRTWATETWERWRPHHAAVEALAALAFTSSASR